MKIDKIRLEYDKKTRITIQNQSVTIQCLLGLPLDNIQIFR